MDFFSQTLTSGPFAGFFEKEGHPLHVAFYVSKNVQITVSDS